MSFFFFSGICNVFLESTWFSLDLNSLVDKFSEFCFVLYEKGHTIAAVIDMEISLDESSESFLEFLLTDEIAFVFKEKIWELSLVLLDLESDIVSSDGSCFQ